MFALDSDDIEDLVVQIGTMTILRLGVMQMLGTEQSPAVRLHLDEMAEQYSVRIDTLAFKALELTARRVGQPTATLAPGLNRHAPTATESSTAPVDFVKECEGSPSA